MFPRSRVTFGVILLALGLAISAEATPSASTDEGLTGMFATYGDSGAGWTGGDGAYSVPLPDGRIVWIFSDTFLGSVNWDHSRPRSAPFIHNSAVIQQATSLTTTLNGGSFSSPAAWVSPEINDGLTFYWMGDGTIQNGRLHVFALRFAAAPTTFVFKQVSQDIASFLLPFLTLDSLTPVPALPTAGSVISWGAAITEDSDYTYIYGVEDLSFQKFLHVARAGPGEILGPWEFFDGTGWSSQAALSVRLLGGVANELSVTKTSDGYRLISQDLGIGADMLMFSATAPQGPWTDRQVVYTTPEPSGNIFTYNAKEHPEFGAPGEFLVSYNVNSFDVNDVYADVDNYRPRFVRIQP